jgi:hypothetical protein
VAGLVAHALLWTALFLMLIGMASCIGGFAYIDFVDADSSGGYLMSAGGAFVSALGVVCKTVIGLRRQ